MAALLLGFVVMLCNSRALKMALLLGLEVMACKLRALEMTFLLGFVVRVSLASRRVASRALCHVTRYIVSHFITSYYMMLLCRAHLMSRCVVLCYVLYCRVMFWIIASYRFILVKRAAVALLANVLLRLM